MVGLQVTTRMSVAAYLALDRDPGKPRKYRNEPVTVDGWRFDSKAEARRYSELKLEMQSGHVLYFLRQVPFHLPGGIIYRADFYVVRVGRGDNLPRSFQIENEKWRETVRAWAGPYINKMCPTHVVVEDVKGVLTRDSKNKIKLVKEFYGIDVQLVRSKARRRVAR